MESYSDFLLFKREHLWYQCASQNPVDQVRHEAEDKEILKAVTTRPPYHDMGLVTNRRHETGCGRNQDCHGERLEADVELVCQGHGDGVPLMSSVMTSVRA